MNELAKALRDLDEDRVNELVDEKLAQKFHRLRLLTI